MDSKKQAQKRQKRQSKVLEENFWDCSVCTFRNTAEAFKCSMCDVRKGTSTRKPRLNPQLVAQQVAQTIPPPPPKPRREDSKERKLHNLSVIHPDGKVSKKKIRNIRPRLKNIDRSQVVRQPVTVNNVTVVITEYMMRSVTSSSQSNPMISTEIPSSSDISNQSEIISVNGEGPVIPTPASQQQ
ncbi:RING1 and YY1-binding protein [Folsomia candida]|uniref:YY1-associated factor 2 n=1 Tax=Folsomia candida TaxID=158441 RepID=A0A226DKG9_FOLCA|nr:RING1 and YY1-binding protein [Folsomia candida]OXA45689.1 YY1-associated factor 2 [Folsomia candida]